MAWRITTEVENRKGESKFAHPQLTTEEHLGAFNAVVGLLPRTPRAQIERALSEGGTLEDDFENPDGSSGKRTVKIELT